MYGKNIRSHGSKNAGLTNTLRALSMPPIKTIRK
ncbi:glycerol-3-phosphate acyltransferase [Sporosarcina psychrophila]